LFLQEQGVSIPRRHLESMSTLTNVGVLQFTDSVGFLALGLARHFAAQGALQILPLALPKFTMNVGLVWMTDRRMGPAQELVRRLLRETAEALPRVAADTSPMPAVATTAFRRPAGVW
jgi:DNA-binding transcriptional LysR family regulator